ncbi:unnamed protein product [Cyprideis torosa]|uniref:Uncharacterized protein n=1 Tax=Cyprideis torosa TaxID=163714 RepID=A0A7R8ZNL7_9CRUS|nr:unnamed protein product [Cyprideis torosa]CAG0896643.1 unnamed protein product [Cyprideis torosa]
MFNCERRIMCAFVVFLSLFLLLNTTLAKGILEPSEGFAVQGSKGNVPKSPSEEEMEWTCTKPTKICPRYRSAAINRHYHNEFWRTQFVNNGSDFLITWTHFSNYCVYIIEGRNAKVQSLASYPSGNILKAKGNHLLVPVAKDLLKVCTAHTIFMEEVGSDCVTTDTLSVGPNATFEGLFWTFQFTDVDDDLSVQHVFEVRWNLLELLPSDAPGFLKIKGYGGQYYTQERPGDFNETGLYRQIVPFSQECQSLHALFDCTTKTRDYSLAIVDADFSIFSAGENITSAAMPVSGLDITIDNERVKTISWNRQPDDRKYVLAWKKHDQSWVSTMEIDLSFPRYSFPKMEFENCVLYDFRIKRITDRGVESCWTEKSFLFPGPLNVTSQLGGSNAFADDLQVRFHDDSPPCAGGYRVRLGRMDKIGIWESEVQVPKSKSVVHFRGISECPSAYIIQVEVIPNFATNNEIVVPAENRSIALEHNIQSSNCHLKVVNETVVRLYWKFQWHPPHPPSSLVPPTHFWDDSFLNDFLKGRDYPIGVVTRSTQSMWGWRDSTAATTPSTTTVTTSSTTERQTISTTTPTINEAVTEKVSAPQVIRVGPSTLVLIIGFLSTFILAFASGVVCTLIWNRWSNKKIYPGSNVTFSRRERGSSNAGILLNTDDGASFQDF